MDAVQVAEKLRESIASLKIEEVKTVTISLGVSEAVATDTPATLFKQLDDKLYHAKEAGKNRVIYSVRG